jgi:ParB-like chromosome segregation protein Spo0J
MTATESAAPERQVALAALGQRLAALRVLTDEPVRRMRDSLAREGQLMPLAAHATGDGLEVVDGFKRLRAARQLGWAHLRVQLLSCEAPQAKAALLVLNAGRGLTEVEEGWLVRSLYREDRLTQPQIARLLARHKSWVSRRLLLGEALDDTVVCDVRLGLLGAGAAAAVARLPRGNHRAAADLVIQRGLTRSQTERLVSDLLTRPPAEATRLLAELLSRAEDAPPPSKPAVRARTAAEWITADVALVTRTSARLQARLLEQPLQTLGAPAARLCREGLAGLRPVLRALERRIEKVLEETDDDAQMVDAAGAAVSSGDPRQPGHEPAGHRAGPAGQP